MFFNFIGRIPQEVKEINANKYHHDDGYGGVLAGEVVGFPLDFLVDESGHVFDEGEDELVLEEDEVVEFVGESVITYSCIQLGEGIGKVVDGLREPDGECAFSKPLT